MGDYKLCEIIEKKSNGQNLDEKDIRYFVNAVSRTVHEEFETEDGVGVNIDRCQIGAMLAFIYLKGLNDFEINQLTLTMRDSGKVFEWPEEQKNHIVDKHSTGGVGDKISLILTPALATCGLLVPMISGRSLGHTGGTLDKLEAIRNCTTSLEAEDIHRAINTIGCCIAGQTDECVPADKVLYHCRDITATTNCLPLIIASIVSKKLSENPKAIVYDVKFGRGSVFISKEEALEAAIGLVKASLPVKATALLTSMEAPLGKTIGDAFEVLEAVECLRGGGRPDICELTTALGNELLFTCTGKTGTEFAECLKNGKALKKFHEMLMLQNVDKETADDLCYGDATKAFRDKAPFSTSISYTGVRGFVSAIDPLIIGKMWKEEYSFSRRNPGIGFILMKTVGDAIESGDTWITFHHQREVLTENQRSTLTSAIKVSLHPTIQPIIEKRVYYKNGSIVVEDYEVIS